MAIHVHIWPYTAICYNIQPYMRWIGIQDNGSGILDPGSPIQDPGFESWIRDRGPRLQDPASKIQDPGSKGKNRQNRCTFIDRICSRKTPNNNSSSNHKTSNIWYPTRCPPPLLLPNLLPATSCPWSFSQPQLQGRTPCSVSVNVSTRVNT